MAVRHVDDLDAGEVASGLRRGGFDPGPWTHQDRYDHAPYAGLERAVEREGVAGVHDGGGDGGERRGRLDQLVEPRAAHVQMHLRQDDAGAAHLLGRRDHQSLAFDHRLALLVQAEAGERNAMMLGGLLLHGHPDGDGIAQADRMAEAQALIEKDRSGAGKLRAEDGGDQCAPPHAVRDDPVKHVRFGEVLVHMRGIHVAGHDREELDVRALERAGQLGAVTDLEFGESPVFDVLHAGVPSVVRFGMAHARTW